MRVCRPSLLVRFAGACALGIALSLSAASGPAAAQGQAPAQPASPAETLVRAWMKDLQTGGATAEAAAVTYDKSTDTVALRGFTYARPLPADATRFARLKIAEARLVGLSSTDALISARTIELKTIESGTDGVPGGMTVSTLDAADVTLPRLARLVPDTDRPFTTQVQYVKELARTRARTVTIGPITVEAGTPEAGATARQDGITVTDLADGRIGTLKIAPLQSDSRGPAGAGTLKLAGLTLSGLDLNAYLRVVDDSAYGGAAGDSQPRPITRSFLLEGFSSADQRGMVALDRLEIGAVRLRQFPRPLGGVMDKAVRDPVAMQSDPAMAAEIASSIVDAVSLERAQLRGFSFGAGTAAKGQLATMDLRNLSARGIDQFEVGGLSLTDPGGEVALKRLMLGQVTLPPPTVLADAGLRQRKGEAVDPLTLLPTVGQIAVDDFSAKGSRGDVRLASASVDQRYFIGPIPTVVQASVKGLQIPVQSIQDQKTREALAALDYSNLDLSLDLNATWNDTTREIALDRLGVALGGLGGVTFNTAIANVPRAVFEKPREAMPILMGVGLRKARLVYRDESLANKLLGMLATQAKQPVETLRKTLATNMPGILGAIPDANLRNRMVYAGIAFVNDPKTLELVSTSNDPIPVAAIVSTFLAGPQNLPGLLKLDVFANRK